MHMNVKLSQAFDLQMGKTPSRNTAEYWGGDHKWVSIADIGSAGKYIHETKEYITDKGISDSSIKVVPKDTVIMSFKLSIGKTAITSEDMYTNEAIMAFIDKGIYSVDPNYLYHLCSGTDWTAGTNKAVMGMTLNKATLSEKMINIPSIEEQKDIADKLDAVDLLIDIQRRQLTKLDDLVKSRFVEMFGKIKHEDSLENLCRFIDYRGKTPEKTDMGLPFITAKNIRMHHMSFETQEFISKETYDKVMTRGFPRVGDVVFTTEAPLGNVCRIPSIDTEFYIGQRIITMQTDSLEPAYLEYALASNEFRKKLDAKASGSTVTGIRSKLLEKLTIPVPPLELQNRFAAFVAEVDKSKLAVKQSLEKLETLKKSLMQQYFE